MVTVILGIDGGFAKLGYAAVELHAHGETILDMGVLETEKSAKKLCVLASSDNFARAQKIAELLDEQIVRFAPKVIAFESMSFPRNASVANKMGMGLGSLAAVCYAHRLPTAQCSPQAAKKALCGRHDASKEQIQAALAARFGSAFTDRLDAMNKGDREHPADALAAVVATLSAPVVLMARSFASQETTQLVGSQVEIATDGDEDEELRTIGFRLSADVKPTA